ncbi:MAG: TadE/TadG family type IV pilus assembly protein [Pseudomonadota bacterium]
MKRRYGIRKFSGNQLGSAAVEFALIAPIFFGLMFSILEGGWYFFVNSAVEQANARAARLIRTGQVQANDISREDFFDEICQIVDAFGDCDDKLTVDVSRFANFAALSADLTDTVCRDADDDAVDALPFNAGAQREIVRVRVCFLYKPLNPGIGLNLDPAGDGHRKIISVNIFRNEPYEDS